MQGVGAEDVQRTCSYVGHQRRHGDDRVTNQTRRSGQKQSAGLEMASGRTPPGGLLTAAACPSREVATGWLCVSRRSQGHWQAGCDFF